MFASGVQLRRIVLESFFWLRTGCHRATGIRVPPSRHRRPGKRQFSFSLLAEPVEPLAVMRTEAGDKHPVEFLLQSAASERSLGLLCSLGVSRSFQLVRPLKPGGS